MNQPSPCSYMKLEQSMTMWRKALYLCRFLPGEQSPLDIFPNPNQPSVKALCKFYGNKISTATITTAVIGDNKIILDQFQLIKLVM